MSATGKNVFYLYDCFIWPVLADATEWRYTSLALHTKQKILLIAVLVAALIPSELWTGSDSKR